MAEGGSLRGQVAVIGVGDTEVGKIPEHSATGLCIDAARRALDDAGLTKNDIDGLVTCNSMAEPHMYHAEAMAEQSADLSQLLRQRRSRRRHHLRGALPSGLGHHARGLQSGADQHGGQPAHWLTREQAMVMQSSSAIPNSKPPTARRCRATTP